MSTGPHKNKFNPTTFNDFFESPNPLQAQIARVIARHPNGLTALEIADLAGGSITAAKATLALMKWVRGVYIQKWTQKGTSMSATYVRGDKADATKPATRREVQEAKRRAVDPLQIAAIETQLTQEAKHMRALAHALVPKRNATQQHQVNRQYLNWISGGVFG